MGLSHSRFKGTVCISVVWLLCWSAICNADLNQFDTLFELAQVYEQQGYKQKSVSLLLEAETFTSETNLSDKLNLKLAQLYFELGEYPLSAKRLDQISISPIQLNSPPENSAPEKIETQRLKIAALNIQAAIASTLNDPKNASEHYRRATQLAAQSHLDVLKLVTQINHLRHAIDHRKKQEATGIAAQVINSTKSLGTDPQSIELKVSTAELLITLTSQGSSKQYLTEALEILSASISDARTSGDVRLESFATGYYGLALLDSGESDTALAQLNKALFLAESVNAFESAYLWQWQSGRAHKSQGRTQKAIEDYHAAIDTLEHVRSELINGSPFTFPTKIQPLFSELSSLLLTQAKQAKEPVEQQAYLSQVQSILEQAKSAELQDYFQNDCVIPTEAVDLSKVEKATAVIYPVVLKDRLEVLINIENQIHQFTSSIGEKDLERLVNDFRDHLQRDQGDEEYKEIGEEVYDVLLADADHLLQQHNIQTLLVIPDGSLRTIPFSALHDGQSFLIEKYAIATTPGISLTLPKQLDIQEASLFAGGISDAVQGFSGLPGVPVELERLKNKHGAQVLVDQEFHKSAIQKQLSSESYSIVHIATHGHFDSNPQKSFLLTYEDRLTMDLLEDSIGHRRLSGNPLELLVLSACETAVGDNRAALGLAGVALKAGARSAVATLWQISDAATVEVIHTFYQETTDKSQTKAQALRTAQRKLIESEQFYHPTDWAPFLLIGNWL